MASDVLRRVEEAEQSARAAKDRAAILCETARTLIAESRERIWPEQRRRLRSARPVSPSMPAEGGPSPPR